MGDDNELLCNGYRFVLWKDVEVLDMDSGDDCTMWKHLLPVNYTLKFIKMVKFMSCIFYHNKKGKERKIFAFIFFRFICVSNEVKS